MSAIAAVFRFDRAAVPAADIPSMLSVMAARSPDGQSSWAAGNVALGHGMLLNTPEANHEQQPLSALDGCLRMVWDGRLDNRDELRNTLLSRGVLPRDDTDPELVLQLFLIFGEKTPERLLGDFAFVIYDQRQRALFCARDHMGARPLHYVLTDQLIAIASDDEALIPFLPRGPQANVDRLVYALIPMLDDFDWASGWVDGVMSLRAASCMVVTAERRVRRRQYWRLGEGRAIPAVEAGDAVDAFAELLERATSARLRTLRSPAMLLSGGIDSACVAAAIARQTAGRCDVEAYSAVSGPNVDCVESAAIRAVLQTLGWRSRQLLVDDLQSVQSTKSSTALREIAWSKPHPVNNSLLLPAALAALAGADGHRVLLHGVSGDLAFYAPDDYYVEVARESGWRAAWLELKLATACHVYNIGYSPSSLLARALWTHQVPLAMKKLRPARRRAARAVAAASGLSDSLIATQRIVERIEHVWARNDCLARQSAQEQHRRVLEQPGLVRGLEGYDRVAGRFGLESRDPLADVRVIEWLYGAPLALKAAEGVTKWVGRQYVRRVFDGSVSSRTDKAHLGEHFIAAALAMASVDADSTLPARDSTTFDALTVQLWLERIGAAPTARAWLRLPAARRGA